MGIFYIFVNKTPSPVHIKFFWFFFEKRKRWWSDVTFCNLCSKTKWGRGHPCWSFSKRWVWGGHDEQGPRCDRVQSADCWQLLLIFLPRSLNLSGVLTGLGSFFLPLKGMAGGGCISVLALWGENVCLGIGEEETVGDLAGIGMLLCQTLHLRTLRF